MSNLKSIGNKIFKTELELHKTNLANVKEVEAILDEATKKHSEAVDLAKKAELFFKIANTEVEKAEKEINLIIKTAKDLGLDVSFIEGRLSMIKTLKNKTSKSLNLNYIP
jgi:flagellar hook-length control protein FliK